MADNLVRDYDDMATECEICSAGGLVTPATRRALERDLCSECADQYEVYLRPGERLEEMTREEINRRIFTNY